MYETCWMILCTLFCVCLPSTDSLTSRVVMVLVFTTSDYLTSFCRLLVMQKKTKRKQKQYKSLRDYIKCTWKFGCEDVKGIWSSLLVLISQEGKNFLLYFTCMPKRYQRSLVLVCISCAGLS